ncbi:putative malonyl CoA-acyl carrier protein transacylase, FabD2 [Mycobacterium xenopi 4042]|uniref:Putative malonyl CoA-acyl carrier protein transacylase, FabD2 n=1 Tax=Mycobacterium xenopi 4042 TaxID=1299334 RepID=X7YKL8_MYCXE|nr:putative malonyl CoA-acyl carrier protein transacylase, FabD2 [Mycobacterium xenopi 4042]
MPCAWRQVVEDVCTVAVDAPTGQRLVYLVDGPTDVELAAGACARLSVVVGTDAHAPLAIEAHLISPWGTWDWITPAACGAVLPAAARSASVSTSRHRRGRARRMVGPGPGWVCRPAAVLTRGESEDPMIVATVGAVAVPVEEVDARETRLRHGPLASSLPARDTSEGRQLRRWLTQLIVTERLIAAEADARGLTAADAPAEAEVLPDLTAGWRSAASPRPRWPTRGPGRCSPT